MFLLIAISVKALLKHLRALCDNVASEYLKAARLMNTYRFYIFNRLALVLPYDFVVFLIEITEAKFWLFYLTVHVLLIIATIAQRLSPARYYLLGLNWGSALVEKAGFILGTQTLSVPEAIVSDFVEIFR